MRGHDTSKTQRVKGRSQNQHPGAPSAPAAVVSVVRSSCFTEVTDRVFPGPGLALTLNRHLDQHASHNSQVAFSPASPQPLPHFHQCFSKSVREGQEKSTSCATRRASRALRIVQKEPDLPCQACLPSQLEWHHYPLWDCKQHLMHQQEISVA